MEWDNRFTIVRPIKGHKVLVTRRKEEETAEEGSWKERGTSLDIMAYAYNKVIYRDARIYTYTEQTVI